MLLGHRGISSPLCSLLFPAGRFPPALRNLELTQVLLWSHQLWHLRFLQSLGFTFLLPESWEDEEAVLINLIAEAPGFKGRRAVGCVHFREMEVGKVGKVYTC